FSPLHGTPKSSRFPYTTLFRSIEIRIPGKAELADVVLVDLRERAVALLAVGAPMGEPVLAAVFLGEDALLIDVGKAPLRAGRRGDRKSTRLNSSHVKISYAVFC